MVDVRRNRSPLAALRSKAGLTLVGPTAVRVENDLSRAIHLEGNAIHLSLQEIHLLARTLFVVVRVGSVIPVTTGTTVRRSRRDVEHLVISARRIVHDLDIIGQQFTLLVVTQRNRGVTLFEVTAGTKTVYILFIPQENADIGNIVTARCCRRTGSKSNSDSALGIQND